MIQKVGSNIKLFTNVCSWKHHTQAGITEIEIQYKKIIQNSEWHRYYGYNTNGWLYDHYGVNLSKFDILVVAKTAKWRPPRAVRKWCLLSSGSEVYVLEIYTDILFSKTVGSLWNHQYI